MNHPHPITAEYLALALKKDYVRGRKDTESQWGAGRAMNILILEWGGKVQGNVSMGSTVETKQAYSHMG